MRWDNVKIFIFGYFCCLLKWQHEVIILMEVKCSSAHGATFYKMSYVYADWNIHTHTRTCIFRDYPSEVGVVGENSNMGLYSIPQTLILHICSIEIYREIWVKFVNTRITLKHSWFKLVKKLPFI